MQRGLDVRPRRRSGWHRHRGFHLPTPQTRAAFGQAFTIWLDRIEAGRFEDTNRLFVAPERFDLRVGAEGAPQYWAEQALARLRPAFDPQKPTALFIGQQIPIRLTRHCLLTGPARSGRPDDRLREAIQRPPPYPLPHAGEGKGGGIAASPRWGSSQ